MKSLKIIDPLKITQNQCPVFIQSGNLRSFFGFAIRRRTKSNFSHSMIMRTPGKVVSQTWFYNEVDIRKYMNPGCMLKFWVCTDITDKERSAITVKINYDLAKPLYKRFYDFTGLIGQFFGLRWFNIPFLNYCSERVRSKVVVLFPVLKPHPTPEDIDSLFKAKKRMEVLGYFLGPELV